MDIAKYIGLYLLKNNFCYIHGLGNMEIKKKTATHDGQVLSAPTYEVLLTPGGSIDDSLANFSATHEQTSISKAANALRDFSIATRTLLHDGKEVEIPSMGKFTEQGGIVRFVTDPNMAYAPPSIPVLRTAKRVEEAPSFKMTEPPTSSYGNMAGMNWGKIAMVVGVIAVLTLIGIFAARFMSNRQPAATAVTEPMMPDTSAALTPPVAIAPADTAKKDTLAPATVAPVAADGQTRVILGTYPTRLAAEKRMKTLTGNGNNVAVAAQDSTTFYVVMPITYAAADSARVLDSLRRMFNPKGVRVYR